MSLTPEENQMIIEMRAQIQGMLDSLNAMAVQLGAEPIPMPTIPSAPAGPVYMPPYQPTPKKE